MREFGAVMGDLSNEPSMEEILSSIKRIIAEEGDAAPRIRRAGRPAPLVEREPEPEGDEVLELNDPMPVERTVADRVVSERPPTDAPVPERALAERPERHAAADRIRPERAVSPAREKEEERVAPPAPDAPPRAASAAEPRAVAEPVLSQGTVDATRGALDHLSRMLVRPDTGSDGTLEGLVREMIRPMLRDWLDTNLPALVEGMVAREIGRITGSRR